MKRIKINYKSIEYSSLQKYNGDEVNQTNIIYFDITDEFPEGAEIISAAIKCSVKPNNGSTGVIINSKINTINGKIPPNCPTIVGPGGIELMCLDFIDTERCDAIGEGTPIIVGLSGDISGQVTITISGDVRVNGKLRNFLVSQVVDIDEFTINRFSRLCIPSTYAVFKPYLADFCAILCNAILPLGLNSLKIIKGTDSTYLRASSILSFCIACEDKIIVPVQIKLLSTGFCEP